MTLLKAHYIKGHWIPGQGRALHSVNPADGSIVWQGQHATEAEVAMASEAAHQALPKWMSLSFENRARYVNAFAEIVENNRAALTTLIAQESGKPLWEAATEVSAVIGKIALSIQAHQERAAEKQTQHANDTNQLRYKPHGVVVVLGAFNFPAHLSNGHIVPALLAGNTVLYKPSELTPGVAAFLLDCWHQTGIPAGTINGIQGDADSARLLLQQDIQGVYFTGSYQTGLAIHKQFSERPDIILALEMGGNNPLVVDTVIDIQAAVYQTVLSSFITAGQRCTCARRVCIPDNAFGDQFLKQFLKAAKALRVGAYTQQPEPFMGPVIRHEHALKHLKAQADLEQAGGQSLLPMSLLAEKTGLLSPGIIDMSAVSEPNDTEIFAPLAQIHRYSSFDEALTIANQTRYGLSASLLSDNAAHYEAFYRTIRAGLINWNKPTTGAASHLPFGGIGRSGNHRPSAYFAVDYCVYPIASVEQATLTMPTQTLPGITLEP